MARNTGSGEDRAKVKFRFIEVELEGANLTLENSVRQIVTAINARSAQSPAPRVLPSRQARELPPPEIQEEDEDQDLEAQSEEETESESAPAKPARVRKPQAFSIPEYKHDLGLDSGSPTFKDFIASKKVTTQTAKYLISAFWLRGHGNSQTIDIHKVYTCFKTAGWSTKINDWDNVFRQCRRANTMRRVSQGEYAITPLGEDAVRELDAAE